MVAPGAVDEKQLAEEAELSDGHIRAPRSLEALLATDTNANVSSLDHRDVVRSVANGE